MNLAHIKCLSMLLGALCTVQTVCLSKLAAAFDNKASRESSFRRIQRFMAQRQYETIKSVKVLEEGVRTTSKWMFNFKEYQNYYNLPEDKQEEMRERWLSYQKLRNLDCGVIGGCLDDSDRPDGKGYAGRFYSIMTNMKSEDRHKFLRLDGELITEVDVSSAQPTFLGIMMYKETGVMSEWLRQCLSKTTDFYEWIKEKTNTQEDRKTLSYVSNRD